MRTHPLRAMILSLPALLASSADTPPCRTTTASASSVQVAARGESESMTSNRSAASLRAVGWIGVGSHRTGRDEAADEDEGEARGGGEARGVGAGEGRDMLKRCAAGAQAVELCRWCRRGEKSQPLPGRLARGISRSADGGGESLRLAPFATHNELALLSIKHSYRRGRASERRCCTLSRARTHPRPGSTSSATALHRPAR